MAQGLVPRGRRDGNEREIVAALRGAGCSVLQLEDRSQDGIPDLLCGYRGEDRMLEVKTATGKVEPEQTEWHALWRGRTPVVVRSVEEALAAVGIEAEPIAFGSRNVAQAGR